MRSVPVSRYSGGCWITWTANPGLGLSPSKVLLRSQIFTSNAPAAVERCLAVGRLEPVQQDELSCQRAPQEPLAVMLDRMLVEDRLHVDQAAAMLVGERLLGPVKDQVTALLSLDHGPLVLGDRVIGDSDHKRSS